MSIVVKGNHPLAEIIGRKLLGIESVPIKEQRRMVARAVKASVEFYEQSVKEERAACAKDVEPFDRYCASVIRGRKQ